jgi:hypothetical protein
MSTDIKFETFWIALKQSAFDLPDELKPILQKSIIEAGFYEPTTVTVANSCAPAKGTTAKKLSGYNLFLKEKMAQLKTENVPSGERMGKVGGLWKGLSDADKKIWNDKAKADDSTTAVTKKSTGTKKLSGYQFYVKEMMPTIKVLAEIKSTERMGEIGKRWKALTDAEKTAYKTKAGNA